MKLNVISEFQDKFTKQLYKPGKVIEIEDESRVEDLKARGLAEPIEEKKEVKISIFEREFEKKELVEALKSINEKATMNMKDETLLANVAGLDEEKTFALKKVLAVEV